MILTQIENDGLKLGLIQFIRLPQEAFSSLCTQLRRDLTKTQMVCFAMAQVDHLFKA